MLPKLLIFAVISTFLVAAIYSTSTYVANAETVTYCSYNKSKTKSTCTNIDDSGPSTDVTNWNCTKNKSGSWSCTEASTQPPATDLKLAINNAVKGHLGATTGGSGSGENNTHITNGNTVKSGGTLKGDDTTQGDTQGTRHGKNSTGTLQ
jgi:hypothetical protein